MEGRWFLSNARAITPFEGGIEELPNSNIDMENPGFPEKTHTYVRDLHISENFTSIVAVL